MAYVMIDDLTGEQHPVDGAHRLTLHLDFVPAVDTGTEIAGWDVASTDPRELLAQLGEHLAGVAAPLVPTPWHQTPEGQRELTELLGPNPHVVARQAAAVEESAENQPADVHDEPSSQVNELGPVDESAEEQPGLSEVLDPDKPEPTVTHTTTETRTAVPEQRATSATQRIGEALGGEATDAVVRAWAVQHDVPCSMTGKLNGWARAAYVRTGGGEPDQQMWRERQTHIDYRATKRPQPSTPVPPDVETSPTPDLDPPSGRASAGTPPTGDDDRLRPEQLELAEELAAAGHTPCQIVDRTGVPLDVARELYASAKGPKR